MTPHRLHSRLHALYEGNTRAAYRFRYTLLALDLATIAFLVVSSFFYGAPWIELADPFFGLYMAADYLARLWIARGKLRFAAQPMNLVDLAAALSFLAPLLGESLGFLRGLRLLRLLRSYRLVRRLRHDFPWFRRNEDIITSATNLFIFVFIVTEIVFITQVGRNPEVGDFMDALYFTITTLTTTGFGDITLVGQSGRLVSIVVMVFGVSLFLRLIQTIFRPAKVRFTCPDCGLLMHESDAVHCKHCGRVLNIPSDGHAG